MCSVCSVVFLHAGSAARSAFWVYLEYFVVSLLTCSAFVVSPPHMQYKNKKTLEQSLKRKTGSEGRIRTCDQVINSHLRYHCATSEQSKLSEIGSEGRIRTCDQVINSHLRYHCATSERGNRFLKKLVAGEGHDPPTRGL